MTCQRCGRCCGPVCASPDEIRVLQAFMDRYGVEAKQQGLLCPFLRPSGCAIYSVRPLLCRMFGHSPDLRCTRNAEREYSKTELMRANKKLLRSILNRCYLHELAGYSIEEVQSFIREHLATDGTTIPSALSR